MSRRWYVYRSIAIRKAPQRFFGPYVAAVGVGAAPRVSKEAQDLHVHVELNCDGLEALVSSHSNFKSFPFFAEKSSDFPYQMSAEISSIKYQICHCFQG